jgi:hypothetical protein
MPRPDVLLGESSRTGMLRGLAACGRLVALPLSPVGGAIANKPEGAGQVEILRDAATAARRLIQLPHPLENPCAMLARHTAWRMRPEAGDDSARERARASMRGAASLWIHTPRVSQSPPCWRGAPLSMASAAP